MANVQKYTRSAVGHLFAHYERGKDGNGNYIKFGNQDIDSSRTHLNYNLAPDHNQLEFLHKRLSEVHCLKREDVNVMCSWVVTAPKDLPEASHDQFFKDSYNYLSNLYGEHNVISAYVHKDEHSDHMHFTFVPVVYDKKKDRDKVSAKELINKNHLKGWHEALEAHLSHSLGFKVNLLNEATKEGNKAISELKTGSAVKELKEITEKLEKVKELEFSVGDIDKTPVKIKGFKNKTVTLSLDVWENFVKAYKRHLIDYKEFNDLKADCRYWKSKYESNDKYFGQLQTSLRSLRSKVKDYEKDKKAFQEFLAAKGLSSEFQAFRFSQKVMERPHGRDR